jgi:hypothetical protein
MTWLKLILGVFTRLWDWFFNPRRVAQRAKDQADAALGDDQKTNEILDKNLP